MLCACFLLATKVFKVTHWIIPIYNHCTTLIFHNAINYVTHIDVRKLWTKFLLTGVVNKRRYHEYQKGDGPGTTQHPGSLHLWTVLGPRSTGLSPLYVWSPTLQLVLRRGPSGLAFRNAVPLISEQKVRALLYFRQSSRTSAFLSIAYIDNDDRFRARSIVMFYKHTPCNLALKHYTRIDFAPFLILSQ